MIFDRFLIGVDPLQQAVSIGQLESGVTKLNAPVEWHIAGVFHNVQNGREFGDENLPEPYVLFAQSPWPQMGVGVRNGKDPASMRYGIAAAVHSLYPRMTLGAQSSSVIRLILREGLMLAVIGFLFGLARACFIGRLMQSSLYGTGSIDSGAFAAVTLVLLLAALLACYIPARPAANVDPMPALRQG